MDQKISDLIERISKLPKDWHGAGSVSPTVLQGIARHAEQIGSVRHSLETGSGKTTLLFSHLSEHHLVFAKDDGKSVSQVKNSPLFKSDTVTYIEGPSQLTLPKYSFEHKADIALIDGPHGYPFPDLEYYYFYPLIETGGLLLVDDLKIPSIHRMFEIIKESDMFDLVDLIGDMAFFKRNSAPLIDPLSDSWWLQGYNKSYYENMHNSTQGAFNKGIHHVAKFTPGFIKKIIPARFKNIINR